MLRVGVDGGGSLVMCEVDVGYCCGVIISLFVFLFFFFKQKTAYEI